jgi:hypothetical protein
VTHHPGAPRNRPHRDPAFPVPHEMQRRAIADIAPPRPPLLSRGSQVRVLPGVPEKQVDRDPGDLAPVTRGKPQVPSGVLDPFGRLHRPERRAQSQPQSRRGRRTCRRILLLDQVVRHWNEATAPRAEAPHHVAARVGDRIAPAPAYAPRPTQAGTTLRRPNPRQQPSALAASARICSAGRARAPVLRPFLPRSS